MIQQGERAPSFTLPGIRDGEVAEISLDDHVGADLVVLAFYPGDFNPGCSDSAADLNDLDLFTMQKDLTLLAISGDSVHSHRAFAARYAIDIPLLSDLRGAVAERYDVAAPDDAGYLTRRAIVVIDHQGDVEYTWLADDVGETYDTEELREVIESVGSDETAVARYRVGHARYLEGRRGFTRAMKAYEDREWMMAQGDFKQASEEFDEARSEFNTAVRFTEDEETLTYYERAETKSEALWRAADWLRESSSAFSSGQGATAESLRSDAEAPLEAARDIHEPPDPDDFPPAEDPAGSASEKGAGTDRSAYLERDGEAVDTSLELDDPAVTDGEPDADTAHVADGDTGDRPPEPESRVTESVEPSYSAGAGAKDDSGSFARGGSGQAEAESPLEGDADESQGDAGEGQSDAGEGQGDAGEGQADTGEGQADTGERQADTGDGEVSAAESIDDEEIEEIAAEIEEESEAARERQAEKDHDLGDLPDLQHGQFDEAPVEPDSADADDMHVYGAEADSSSAAGTEGAAENGSRDETAGTADGSTEAVNAGDGRDVAGGDDAGDAGVTADSGDARGNGNSTAAGGNGDSRDTAEPGGARESEEPGVTEKTSGREPASDSGPGGSPPGGDVEERATGVDPEAPEDSVDPEDAESADNMDLDLDLTDPTETDTETETEEDGE